MKIMVVGGGGREHAIIKKLKENKVISEIYALPGNGGIANDALIENISATDIDAIKQFAVNKGIDYAIVAPDDPLVLGCVDELESVGIPCFGPNKAAAIIEGSKVFSKNLMKKYNIPTAAYEVFDDMEKALNYLKTAPIPTVIKANGLALGKGVIIAQTRDEAFDAVKSMMADKVFGKSGESISTSISCTMSTRSPSRYTVILSGASSTTSRSRSVWAGSSTWAFLPTQKRPV